MTDNSELKRLADELIAANDLFNDSPQDNEIGDAWSLANDRFTEAASPESILALIAENEELGRYLCTCRDCGGEGSLHTGDWHSYGHMEPPEPVMEKCGECDGTGLLGEIQDLYQVITERDQLRTEIAGLKTGYEAYERVNAELKAEVEALRKDADRLQSATAFVQKLCDSAGKQPSVATGYLHDILSALGQGEQS